MSDLPAKQNGFWLVRVLSGVFKGYGKKEEKPVKESHGANWNNPYGTAPPYSPSQSLAAYAGHGYVYAAVSRSSADLAALPLKLLKGKGKDASEVTDGPVIDLFESPSTDMSGYLFREQLRTDLMLSGNCYILLLGLSDQPDSIIRLHPDEVEIITEESDGLSGYRHSSNGVVVVYPPDRVLHGRNAGYSKGPQSLYGTGIIEPLTREINADINAQKLASTSSAKGRPDILIHPIDPADVWGYERRREILDQYKGLASEGGAMVLSGQVAVEPLKLTPREMEFEASRRMARESISAVSGVPPTVLGLPSANYAQSRQQSLTYWSNQQKAAKRLDHLYSQVAALFDPEYSIAHDFSGVEALQSVRDSQLLRVQQHIANGISVADAYAYEGMSDAPVPGRDEQAAPDFDDDPPDTRSLEIVLSNLSRFDSEKNSTGKKAEGETTDFPKEGDDKKVSLRNSEYQVFDVDFAFMIKEKYPSIWNEGGNIEGNNQFKRLYPIAQRQDKSPKTDTEDMAIRKREAWSARHYKDFRIAGVIAQIKWLTVGSRGESYMKELVREEIKKIEADKEAQKKKIWLSWIERRHGPQEDRLYRASRSYLKGAAKRYARRLRGVMSTRQSPEGAVIKAVTDWSELFSADEEKRRIIAEIGSVWIRGWKLTGSEELTKVYRLANKDKPEGLSFEALDVAAVQTNRMASEVVRTSSDKVMKIVEKGLMEGLSTDEIANLLMDAKAFDKARATLIARTEATRSVNGAAIQAYEVAAGEGIGIQKQWLTADDDKVRFEHTLLDGQTVYPSEVFSVSGMEASGPGEFGEADMDCNCRCTVVPFIVDL